jgi:hypothetical protein
MGVSISTPGVVAATHTWGRNIALLVHGPTLRHSQQDSEPACARRIINALDQADTIRDYAVNFETVLKNSQTA